MTILDLVAVDIETTGFDVSDTVTVVGFALPLGCRVFVHRTDVTTSEASDAQSLSSAVGERVDHHVQVSEHSTESALLEAVGEFVATRLADDDVLLVAYNADTWQGGFDLPFLRTRLARADLEWPFTSVPYADLLPLIRKRFNTTVAGESDASLPAAYAALCEGAVNAVDPFEDSAEAVTAFEDNEYADLVVHNVADILRTAALGRVTRRYCAKSEYQMKSLTPTNHEQ